jgi:hypothetical protein
MTQQLITKIKNKIQEIQQLISNYKQEITAKENTLLNLLEELNTIELNMKNNNQISPRGSNINNK